MTSPRNEQIEQLQRAIAALESQRAALGELAADTALSGLRRKLAELEAHHPAEQRKLVTVLFADLAGFTAMAENMEPEDVAELMTAYFDLWRGAIEQHGGVVEKFIGDAVMAVFGIPQAGERDAENAIRAALEGLQRLETLNSELMQTRQVRLGVRVGIHTGLVMVEEPDADGGFVVFGDTVNTASRLQQAAPVGGVLIAHETFRHVRGVFDVSPPETIQVKGKQEPVQTYHVRRARPRAFRLGTRGFEGIETRMVGRAAELAALQNAFTEAIQRRQQRAVMILGEAGIGKSRLLYEFNQWLDMLPERVRFFKGRATQELQHQPYALLRDLFAFRFQIQDSDRAAVAREKLEQGICDSLGFNEAARRSAHCLGQLLGFDFSSSPLLSGVLDNARLLRDRALAGLSEYFGVITRQQPALLLLEDLHWADESSLDAVSSLADSILNHPWLIVVAARPTLLERRPGWEQEFGGRLVGGQITISLQPLSLRSSRALVDEILRRAGHIPAALYEMVTSKAEGNPYYVEELIKMLVEEGAIRTGEERWSVDETRLTGIHVPSTLTGLLQARLDSLPPAEHAAIQRAAIIGRTFWDAALTHLASSEQNSRPALPASLAALQTREFIFQRAASSFVQAREYVFKHDILRQVAYESLPRRERRLYHRRAAEWLMAHSGERVGEFTGLIADHLELSGQVEQALLYLARAGERAAARFASAEAIACLTRALRLAPEADAARRFELILAREKVYSLRGARAEESADIAALSQLAESLNDDRKRAAAALRQAQYADVTADYPAAVAAAETAIRLAQASGDAENEAAGRLLWGRVLWRRGDHLAARPQLEQALNLAQRARLLHLEADSLRNLGIVCMYLNDAGKAGEYYHRALEICRQTGDRQGECAALHNLGILAINHGEHALASRHYEEALRIFREIGDRRFEANSLVALGGIREYYGQYSEATRLNEQALAIFREIRDRWGTCGALYNLGLFAHYQREFQTAQAKGEEALKLARELGAQPLEAYALTVLGHTHTGLGNFDAAETAYKQALDIRRGLGEHGAAYDTLSGLARLALARSDVAAALRQASEIWQELNTPPAPELDNPLPIYLACYRAFSLAGEDRATAVLARAREILRARAARIEDEALRRSYLENIPAHREIIEAANEPDPL